MRYSPFQYPVRSAVLRGTCLTISCTRYETLPVWMGSERYDSKQFHDSVHRVRGVGIVLPSFSSETCAPSTVGSLGRRVVCTALSQQLLSTELMKTRSHSTSHVGHGFTCATMTVATDTYMIGIFLTRGMHFSNA